MKCIISLGGEALSKKAFDDLYDESSFLLGVDSGCTYFEAMGLTPHCILGDFDSISKDLLDKYQAMDIPIHEFPVRKNYTDSELALKFGKEKGFDSFYLIGTGPRGETDHFLGNLFLLFKYPEAVAVLEKERIWGRGEGSYRVPLTDGPYFSIVPLGPTEISLKGFSYEGTFKTDLGETLTLRNQIVEDEGEIEVLTGKVLFIQRKP